MTDRRRPNLATIVGSGLAAVAAGSLLAFSSLAEQAGLQGLATGGLQPTVPARGGGTRAIRLPAPPAGAPGEPAAPIEQIVIDAIARADSPATARAEAPAPRVTPGAPGNGGPGRPEKKDKPEPRRRKNPGSGGTIAIAARKAAPGDGVEAPSDEGPPYGNAWGHDKKAKKPHPGKGHAKKAAKKKSHDAPKPQAAPVYARGKAGKGKAKHEDQAPEWKPAKPAKSKKIDKHMPGGNGKAKGHSKPESRGNGHGHTKHDKSHGKGKGHSKHGA